MRCVNFRLRVPAEGVGKTVQKVRRSRLYRCGFDGIRSLRQRELQDLPLLTFLEAHLKRLKGGLENQ